MNESQHPPGLPEKPKSFPDAATCKVRRLVGTDGIYDCLGFWGAECPHMILFGGNRFCRHPDALTGLIPQAPGFAAT